MGKERMYHQLLPEVALGSVNWLRSCHPRLNTLILLLSEAKFGPLSLVIPQPVANEIVLHAIESILLPLGAISGHDSSFADFLHAFEVPDAVVATFEASDGSLWVCWWEKTRGSWWS